MSKKKPFSTAFIVILVILLVVIAVAVYMLLLKPEPASPVLPPPDFLPAFPGAQGFGARTAGGRFGRVLFVTNLNDTTDRSSSAYQGSLRWALETTWRDDPNDPYDQGRIIIFKVGGTIELVDELRLTNPYVTIAGQTAPGCGITLKNEGLTIATHDVIVRNIRVRVGDHGGPTCCRDGLSLSTSHADSDVYNVIVDHSSVSWAIDENMSLYVSPNRPLTLHDVTIQWSISSEGLYNSVHIDEGASAPDPHSMGLIAGARTVNVTIAHNLFAHNDGRNPRVDGVQNVEVANNLIYGWGYGPLELGDTSMSANIINNYFKPLSRSHSSDFLFDGGTPSQTRIYQNGNVTEGSDSLKDVRMRNSDGFIFSSAQIFTPSYLLVYPARDAYTQVLVYAGAIAHRDAVDARIISDVNSNAGDLIDSQEQVGGWPVCSSTASPLDTDADGIPDEWELANGLNPADPTDASNPNFLSPFGYTWIEEYINQLIPSLETVIP